MIRYEYIPDVKELEFQEKVRQLHSSLMKVSGGQCTIEEIQRLMSMPDKKYSKYDLEFLENLQRRVNREF